MFEACFVCRDEMDDDEVKVGDVGVEVEVEVEVARGVVAVAER